MKGKFYIEGHKSKAGWEDESTLILQDAKGYATLDQATTKAKEHFESGFRKAFTALRQNMDQRFPLTVYYAFKQDDEPGGGDDSEGDGSVDLTTGWETLLEALIFSGFQITATWPVRASQKWRMVSMGTNALASYIVLACRPRQSEASQCGRREFLNELKRELPGRTASPPAGERGPGGLCPSGHRPRNVYLFEIREDLRIKWQAHDRAHGLGVDQPDAH